MSRYDSPPMYSPPYSLNGYGPPGEPLDPRSLPPESYYIQDQPQDFFKWSSPPGIMKILEAISLLLCLGIFACVASTLAWDMGYGGGMGLGMGMGMGMGGYGMGGYGGYGGGYSGGYGGYGGGYSGGYGGYGASTSPQAAKGFMIAMAAITFIEALAVFVVIVSKSQSSRGRRFYLLVMVFSGLLAGLELIATIVFIVGVNPMAQSSTSMYYSQVMMMCQSVYNSGTLVNQYLYHYCVVDPQEAVAMVGGFLVAFAQALIIFFAHRTRSKIWRYGKHNIYWDKPVSAGPEEGRDVEDWVNNVQDGNSTHAETLVYSEKVNMISNSPPAKASSYFSSGTYTDRSFPAATPLDRPPEYTGPVVSSSPSEEEEGRGVRRPAARRGKKKRRRNPELDESQYETEYTTGADTCDELDQGEWESLYPPIRTDQERQEYKREFDSDLKVYKRLCAEMDDVNDQMNQLSRQLDSLQEGSPQYQGVAEEYNRLKDLKQTPDYQANKLQCRQLRSKLFHIKSLVNNYDKQRP
ncbi:occludin-like [Acipenser oxyrinchus oxyrinchus]|uniref:Occludin n=1 Tax=Acipenser oxyrinchus oxyrinchus TaxID=40147 RepID=A0AAD8CM15_ACIOX|nr:occludin-like [Acipenser oxyrinchus oxyrinchus]